MGQCDNNKSNHSTASQPNQSTPSQRSVYTRYNTQQTVSTQDENPSSCSSQLHCEHLPWAEQRQHPAEDSGWLPQRQLNSDGQAKSHEDEGQQRTGWLGHIVASVTDGIAGHLKERKDSEQ